MRDDLPDNETEIPDFAAFASAIKSYRYEFSKDKFGNVKAEPKRTTDLDSELIL